VTLSLCKGEGRKEGNEGVIGKPNLKPLYQMVMTLNGLKTPREKIFCPPMWVRGSLLPGPAGPVIDNPSFPSDPTAPVGPVIDSFEEFEPSLPIELVRNRSVIWAT
jgi:hypothetical protein